jgi:diguanylate cyclase (GGDEF)-like protein
MYLLRRKRNILTQIPRKIFLNSNSGFILVGNNGKSYFTSKNLPTFFKTEDFHYLLNNITEKQNLLKLDKSKYKLKKYFSSFTFFKELRSSKLWYEIYKFRFRYFGKKDFLLLVNDISKFKNKEEELKSKLFLDELTNLYNKNFLYITLESEISRLPRVNKPLSILFLDIDYFKEFNDTYGHIQGDKCLGEIAKSIKNSLLRKSDIPIRFGGDEFLCILPYTDKKGAEIVAKRIQENVSNLKIQNPKANSYLSISQGIYTISSGEIIKLKSEDIIQMADEALYNAKKEGKNCIYIYQE